MEVSKEASQQAIYAEVTPAGVFYATSSLTSESSRSFLFNVLEFGFENQFSAKKACEWTGFSDTEEALRLVFRLQRLGFLRGTPEPIVLQEGRLEDILPPLLQSLSDQKKAMLADANGFYLAASGFTHESSEELAALSADFLSMQERHDLLLKNNLRLNSQAWAMVDPSGRSELGFWPLFLGGQRFVLTIGGTPRLQDQSFVTMVQALYHRYHLQKA